MNWIACMITIMTFLGLTTSDQEFFFRVRVGAVPFRNCFFVSNGALPGEVTTHIGQSKRVAFSKAVRLLGATYFFWKFPCVVWGIEWMTLWINMALWKEPLNEGGYLSLLGMSTCWTCITQWTSHCTKCLRTWEVFGMGDRLNDFWTTDMFS